MAYTKQTVSDGQTITADWGNHIQTQYDEGKADLNAHLAGSSHIPSGGSAGQVLGYGGSSGVASWINGSWEKIYETAQTNFTLIDFTNIPTKYNYFKVILLTMSSSSSYISGYLRFNNDSGINYRLGSTTGYPGITIDTAKNYEGYNYNFYTPTFFFITNVSGAIKNVIKVSQLSISSIAALNSGVWENTNKITSMSVSFANQMSLGKIAILGME